MPDAAPPLQADLTFEELQQKNEETARKLSEQGRDLTKPPGPDDFKDVSEGLDALAEQVSKKNDPAAIEAEAKAKAEADAAAKAASETPEQKAAAEAAAAAKAAEDAANEAAKQRANEVFKDAPELAPNASPKSRDAFEGIKIRAAREIGIKEAEIEKLKKDIAERDEKLKNPIPPETEKEIKELREWRAKLDVEADPKFKEFDSNANNIREFIYEQLRKSPNVQGDKLIEKIKSLGGPEMVNWEKIYASLADPTLESIIKAKVSDIELLKFNKAEAIKTAKVNIDKYIQERGSESTKVAEGRLNDTKQHLDGLTSKFDFLKPKTIDPKADAATKKAAEDHNAWVKDVNDNIAYSLQKDDPETRAILIAGMVNLMHLGPRHEALKAAHEAATAKIKELEASIAKIKGASVNRIREGNAPASGDLPKPKTDEHRFNVPATQSLDDIAKEIMERRKAAGQ